MYSIRSILSEFMKENKGTLAKYFLLSLSFPVNDVVLPYYYGQIIEQATRSEAENIWKNTRRTIIIVLVLWTFKQICLSKLETMDSEFLPQLQSYFRKNVVIRILEVHKTNYRDPEIGKLLTQITRLPYAVEELFHQCRHFILPISLTFIFVIGYLFYVHPHLGMIGLAGLLTYFAAVYFYADQCIEKHKQKEEACDQLNEDITDLLANMLSVYSADTMEEELILLEEKQRDLDKKYKETIACSAKFKTIFNSIYMLIFTSVNGYSFYLYSQGKIPVGLLSSTLIITLYVIGMLENASRDIRDFAANVGVLIRLQKIINKLGVPPSPGESPNFKPRGDLVVENLKISYNGRSLQTPHLHIAPLEKVAIIGKSGCGKTSLAKALVRLVPYEGNIYLDGKNIQELDCKFLRRNVLFVPQQARLFNRTVLENILYGNKVTREEVERTLQELKLNITDEDLDRMAGKNGSNLSGGQQQVVYFLRFLFRDSPVIILDEPTASLDEGSRDQVLRILQYISQGRTLIVISHDPAVMNFATRRIKLR